MVKLYLGYSAGGPGCASFRLAHAQGGAASYAENSAWAKGSLSEE